MYWVYDLPNWLFGTLTIAVAEAIALGGLYATRKWVRRIHGTEHSHNEDVAWPLQRRGIIPQNEGLVLSTVQSHLVGFEPRTEGQKELFAEAHWGFSRLAELRGRRLQSVREGLPGPLWTIVLAGALLSIAVTWFFDMRSRSMHVWMTVMFSALLGLLIFLLGAMDNPFRGEISVSPEPFELVYQRRMQAGQ
jgi:Protein of unknown function (DUF4239)